MDDKLEKFPFAVNSDSRPEVAERALQGLRRMVEMGRAAQEALEALERDGHYDHLVHWVEGDKQHSVLAGRMPAMQEISLADAPMLDGLGLALGAGSKSQYGGHRCVEYRCTCEEIASCT